MEKIEYVEYQEVIKPEEEEILVMVQIPKSPEYPVHIIEQAGRRMLRFTLKEFEGVNGVVTRALKAEGWVEIPETEKKDREYGAKGNGG